MYLKHCKGQIVLSTRYRLTYIKTLIELLLLLVYYTEEEVDLIGLFKVGFHSHYLRECFLGVL